MYRCELWIKEMKSDIKLTSNDHECIMRLEDADVKGPCTLCYSIPSKRFVYGVVTCQLSSDAEGDGSWTETQEGA